MLQKCLTTTGLFIGFFLVNVYCSFPQGTLDSEANLSVWYYLCMGSNAEASGVCNVEDQNLSLAYDIKAERDEALKQKTIERIKENGLLGTLKLWADKNTLNYYDGTFGWWGEGGFYTEAIEHGESAISEFLVNFYYADGKYYSVFLSIMQGIWLAVLILSCFCGLLGKADENTGIEIGILMLSILGLSLFEMIFECRARYMFTYVPIYIICASFGVKNIAVKIKR